MIGCIKELSVCFYYSTETGARAFKRIDGNNSSNESQPTKKVEQ